MTVTIDEFSNTETSTIEECLCRHDDKGAADALYTCEVFASNGPQLLLKYADRFTDPVVLYDLIISVYTDNGYNFPKRLIQIAKHTSKRVPDEHRLVGLPDGDPITVYRGTSVANPDCANVMKAAVSWTTDLSTAVWFANRISNPNTGNGKGAVWQATIPRNKIIAYTQDRNESEIIQHMNVQNPRIMYLSNDEWDSILQKQLNKRRAMQEHIWGA